MRTLLSALCVLLLPTTASAANILFTFNSTSQTVSGTLTNPYNLESVSLSGTYNVNNDTYTGNASDFNTLLMNNTTDYMALDVGGVQRAIEIDRIVSGNGNDVVDFSSTNFSIAGTIFFGGAGNQVIWGNVGNDEIHPGNGQALVDGGPGTDTLAFSFPFSSYTITQTGPNRHTVTKNDSTSTNDVWDMEFAQFSDQTVPLATPEPSETIFLAAGAVGFWLPRARRR